MGFEHFQTSNEPVPEQTVEQKKSPERIMKTLKFLVERVLNKFEVQGKEHLAEIPPDKKVILATSHATDFDIPLAYHALCNDLKIRFTWESILERFSVDPLMAAAFRAGGKENFLPIDYEKKKEGQKTNRGKFNPDDYIPMQEAAEAGDAILLAAHSPSHEGTLTEHEGYADVYLAQLVDGVIVPVAIDINSKEPAVTLGTKIKNLFTKSDAKVMIGNPLSFPKIPGVEHFGDLIRKSKIERLTPEERAEVHRIRVALREQSEQVMLRIAEMMPEEKRGIWEERLKLEHQQDTSQQSVA